MFSARRTGSNYRRHTYVPLLLGPAQERADITTAMTDRVPVLGLFETHLTVSDLLRSIGFYRNIVGLQLAFEVS